MDLKSVANVFIMARVAELNTIYCVRFFFTDTSHEDAWNVMMAVSEYHRVSAIYRFLKLILM